MEQIDINNNELYNLVKLYFRDYNKFKDDMTISRLVKLRQRLFDIELQISNMKKEYNKINNA